MKQKLITIMFGLLILLAAFVSAEEAPFGVLDEEDIEEPENLFAGVPDLEPAECGDGICEANPHECIDDCLEAASTAQPAEGTGAATKSILPIAIPIVVVTFLLVMFVVFIKKKEIKLLNPHNKFKVKMKRRKYKPKSRR